VPNRSIAINGRFDIQTNRLAPTRS